jgi:hypothetical protein
LYDTYYAHFGQTIDGVDNNASVAAIPSVCPLYRTLNILFAGSIANCQTNFTNHPVPEAMSQKVRIS